MPTRNSRAALACLRSVATFERAARAACPTASPLSSVPLFAVTILPVCVVVSFWFCFAVPVPFDTQGMRSVVASTVLSWGLSVGIIAVLVAYTTVSGLRKSQSTMIILPFYHLNKCRTQRNERSVGTTAKSSLLEQPSETVHHAATGKAKGSSAFSMSPPP